MFKSCGFKSHHQFLNGIFHVILLKNCKICLKRPKINEKEAMDDSFNYNTVPFMTHYFSALNLPPTVHPCAVIISKSELNT